MLQAGSGCGIESLACRRVVGRRGRRGSGRAATSSRLDKEPGSLIVEYMSDDLTDDLRLLHETVRGSDVEGLLGDELAERFTRLVLDHLVEIGRVVARAQLRKPPQTLARAR